MRVPAALATRKRLAHLSAADNTRTASASGSGFGRRLKACVGRELVYPTNVLHVATECQNRGRSAAFTLALPLFFIQLFTTNGDCVLDPFLGSGTTCVAAKLLGGRYVGIELDAHYFSIAASRIARASREAQVLATNNTCVASRRPAPARRSRRARSRRERHGAE